MQISRYAQLNPLKSCFVLGCVSALSFAPTQNLVTLIIGFLGFLWLFEGNARSLKNGMALYFMYAYGYYGLHLYWVSLSVIPAGMAYLAPLGMLTFPLIFCILSLWIGALLYRIKPYQALYPFAFGIMIWIQEWIIGHVILGGFPWVMTGYAWNEWGMQLSAYIGIYGLSAITHFWMALLYKPTQKKNILAILIFSSICAFGYIRYTFTPLKYTQTTIRIVHPNVNQCDKHRADQAVPLLECHKSLSTLPSENPIQLVVWPEAALMYPLNLNQDLQKQIASVVPDQGYAVIGAPRYNRTQTPTLYTSAYVLSQNQLIDVYDKIHLVPFGEYLPFKDVLHVLGLKKLTQGLLDFSPGAERNTLELNNIPPFVILICYEIIFSGNVNKTVGSKKPQWILNITNDAWYLGLTGP
ncbi:MAG: apolipoprotein N-acyltransferase, partial [Alphaproteobacteria bacterium]|nr:apolipoprotein N-acyltransferase [Alphaproteobacteria bacterium]